ncbi:hypothetical protein M8J77_023022 [Diaphorina citri]|nr:hypothetical protein M8J77_023022 [Diaphorina citri]
MTNWNKYPDRQLNKERFLDILTSAWSLSMTIQNITSGFRATGIYPFDKNAITEIAYAPSELTFLEIPDETERNEDFDDPGVYEPGPSTSGLNAPGPSNSGLKAPGPSTS